MNTCTVEGCLREVKAKGLCVMHHQRLRRTGATGSAGYLKGVHIQSEYYPAKAKEIVRKKCNAANCVELGVSLGFCEKHVVEFGFANWKFGHEG
jgi:hypothetical protein